MLKILALTLLFTQVTFASIGFEPYLSLGQASIEKTPYDSSGPERALWRGQSYNIGARIGKKYDDFFLAFDFEKSKADFKEKSNPLNSSIDYESDFYSYGLSLAYTLPSIPMRLLMRWLYRVQGKEDINYW